MGHEVRTDREYRAVFPQQCVVCMQPATVHVDRSHDCDDASSPWLGGWDGFFGEGDYLVPTCRRHFLSVAIDFWNHRVGLMVAALFGLMIYIGLWEDGRVHPGVAEYGWLFSIVPCVAISAFLDLTRKPWIDSEARGGVAIYSIRNPQFAVALLAANPGKIRYHARTNTERSSDVRRPTKRRKRKRG